jgi:hypothetical protein
VPQIAFIALAGALLACGGAEPAARRPQAVVEVAAPPASARFDGVAPPPPLRLEPVAPDPFVYYVGWWDGVADERIRTLLHVERDGRFEVQSIPQPGDNACVIAGRLRVEPDAIQLHVEQNTCNPNDSEPVLERPIVSRTDDAFTVRSPDALRIFRYTRRRAGRSDR